MNSLQSKYAWLTLDAYDDKICGYDSRPTNEMKESTVSYMIFCELIDKEAQC